MLSPDHTLSPFQYAQKATAEVDLNAWQLDLWIKARWDLDRQVSVWKHRALMLHQQATNEMESLMRRIAPSSQDIGHSPFVSGAAQDAYEIFKELEDLKDIDWSDDNVTILSRQVTEVAALLDKVPVQFGEAESKARKLHAIEMFAAIEFKSEQCSESQSAPH